MATHKRYSALSGEVPLPFVLASHISLLKNFQLHCTFGNLTRLKNISGFKHKYYSCCFLFFSLFGAVEIYHHVLQVSILSTFNLFPVHSREQQLSGLRSKLASATAFI